VLSSRALAGLLVAGALVGCAAKPPVPASLPPRVGPPAILSPFGEWQGAGGRPRAWQHYGVDLRAPVGTPVLAAADGTVLRTGEHQNAGRLIVLGHAADLSTVYWHLSAISVEAGRAVRRGQAIGRSGMTGNATTPHLHFGVCGWPRGECGGRLDAGWEDPGRHWLEGDACFVAARVYPLRPVRFSYPVPCAPGPTLSWRR
jgi:murein DD-endopeptidase MepM/ murein hydrolase activator NlpD